MRKITHRLNLYLDGRTSVDRTEDYYGLVRERREVYGYLERRGHLPISARFSEDWSADLDLNQHYACKVASVADPSRMEDFVNGEIQIFRSRLEQMNEKEILLFWAEEYITRLVEPVRFNSTEQGVVIEVDGDQSNWMGQEKVSLAVGQKVAGMVNRGERIRVRAGFWHFYGLKERMENGRMESGVAGVKSMLIRAFADMLSWTTEKLYQSNQVGMVYDVKERVQPLEAIKLEEKFIPGCIKRILDRLRQDQHLKYQDRTNLVNFLKNIGVPLEDAVSLLRSHFNCTPDRFDKEYRYAIRHTYGQVGSRKDYKSIPCAVIMKETGMPGCSGCPYARDLDGKQKCNLALTQLLGFPVPVHLSPAEYYTMARKASK
ncbi:DNA primase large subunit [Nematocida homosporus]|uniref:DNA primase large subunit n=1 Tax=Nematocida homosporus TaxID=1912981 RepID=UPI00222039AE|nr:DNA primase large subunit [Nematocida homosporus]KAI5185897.1 DNA primase large subunit [Nematocida homosporus]